MAKRFTDTNKYKKPFIRNLPAAYKLLWDFLYHDCDHAGVWIVDFAVAQMYIGTDAPIKKEKAIELFNSDEVRIVEIDNNKKWFIPSFLEFQYGRLSEKNRAHINVISILKKFDLLNKDLTLKNFPKPLTSPLQGAKEQEQEVEQEQEMDMEQENFGKSENLLIPQMLTAWKKKKPQYPVDKYKDFHALGDIAKFICEQLQIPYHPRDDSAMEKVMEHWEIMAGFISKTDHINSYSLGQVAKHSQTIVQKIQNENGDHKTGKSGAGKVNRQQLDKAFADFYSPKKPA